MCPSLKGIIVTSHGLLGSHIPTIPEWSTCEKSPIKVWVLGWLGAIIHPRGRYIFTSYKFYCKYNLLMGWVLGKVGLKNMKLFHHVKVTTTVKWLNSYGQTWGHCIFTKFQIPASLNWYKYVGKKGRTLLKWKHWTKKMSLVKNVWWYSGPFLRTHVKGLWLLMFPIQWVNVFTLWCSTRLAWWLWHECGPLSMMGKIGVTHIPKHSIPRGYHFVTCMWMNSSGCWCGSCPVQILV